MKTPEQLIQRLLSNVQELELTSPKPNLRLYIEHQIQTIVWVLDDDLPEWVAEKVEIYID